MEKKFSINGNWVFDSLSKTAFNIEHVYGWQYDSIFKRTYVYFSDGRTLEFSDCSYTGDKMSTLLMNYVIN
jgi:hypothetical protein